MAKLKNHLITLPQFKMAEVLLLYDLNDCVVCG